MTKNLLKSMFATIATLSLSLSAQAQCYIIGNDGNWTTNRAGAELQATQDKGVYKGDVNFTEGNRYFLVCTQLTEASDDWDGLLPNRYSPETHDKEVIYNEPTKLIQGVDASFMVCDEGTHGITVDFNNMTVTVDGTYPEHIYLVGTNGQWTPGEPSVTLNRTEGTSTYTGKADVSSQWFAFFTDFSDTDWDALNSCRYAYNGPVDPNTVTNLYRGSDYTGVIERMGTYDVTVNWGAKTFSFDDPAYNPERYVYFIGDANNWHTSTCFAQLPESSETGVYTGNVTFATGYFAIGTRLTGTESDWDMFNAYRFSPTANGEPVTENSAFDLVKGDNGAFLVEEGNDGTYSVTVDLNQQKMFVDNFIPTGISSAQTTATQCGQYYDLTGRALGTQKPAKGLYIRNGKKIAVE